MTTSWHCWLASSGNEMKSSRIHLGLLPAFWYLRFVLKIFCSKSLNVLLHRCLWKSFQCSRWHSFVQYVTALQAPHFLREVSNNSAQLAHLGDGSICCIIEQTRNEIKIIIGNTIFLLQCSSQINLDFMTLMKHTLNVFETHIGNYERSYLFLHTWPLILALQKIFHIWIPTHKKIFDIKEKKIFGYKIGISSLDIKLGYLLWREFTPPPISSRIHSSLPKVISNSLLTFQNYHFRFFLCYI